MQQIITTLAAIPAFLPITFCPGYVAAWLTNLHGFRERSLVERIFWSIPLSIAIATISFVLVGRFASLGIAAALAVCCLFGCIAIFLGEAAHLRRAGRKANIGFAPIGSTVLVLSAVWIAFVILSLVDFENNQRLFMSLTFYDIGTRVDWANSILRSGIPPANPHYFYLHPANLRYYYFWLADCAVVAKYCRLPMRSIIEAGCVWAGFILEALTGLLLKHFLAVGDRLRRQFLVAALLPAVGGFSLLIYFGNMILLHASPPGNVWEPGQIEDFVNFFLYYPHHLCSMVCCIFAFLLAWMSRSASRRDRAASVIFIALALASSFGLSVYVAFAFFLVMACWALWHTFFLHEWRMPARLFAGGMIAAILLAPYLYEITHTESKMTGEGNGAGGASGSAGVSSPFKWHIRETIPPDHLAHSKLLSEVAHGNPEVARSLAKLILISPGFALELGVYFIALAIFLVPAWRGRKQFTGAQKSIVFIVVVAFPVTAFIRSSVINVNDFGMHSALFIQYPLLLLLSELLIAWKLRETKAAPDQAMGLPGPTPFVLRSFVSVAIIIGIFSTTWWVLCLRFILPLSQIGAKTAPNPQVGELPHKAYFSHLGYVKLDHRIAKDAVVQFNPSGDWMFWKNVDLISLNRQTAISTSGLWCGSELGGDPSGCPGLLAAVMPLYNDANADQARAACKAYRIDYLIANIYDQPWKDQASWVWTLPPVVTDPEFRAVDCR